MTWFAALAVAAWAQPTTHEAPLVVEVGRSLVVEAPEPIASLHGPRRALCRTHRIGDRWVWIAGRARGVTGLTLDLGDATVTYRIEVVAPVPVGDVPHVVAVDRAIVVDMTGLWFAAVADTGVVGVHRVGDEHVAIEGIDEGVTDVAFVNTDNGQVFRMVVEAVPLGGPTEATVALRRGETLPVEPPAETLWVQDPSIAHVVEEGGETSLIARRVGGTSVIVLREGTPPLVLDLRVAR